MELVQSNRKRDREKERANLSDFDGIVKFSNGKLISEYNRAIYKDKWFV